MTDLCMAGAPDPDARPPIDFDALEARAVEFKQVLFERAGSWEVQFDAGPGRVCSLSDAAWVLARYVIEAGS